MSSSVILRRGGSSRYWEEPEEVKRDGKDPILSRRDFASLTLLKRLHLRVEDLDDLSSNRIRALFNDLAVKDILELCLLSENFNEMCGRELLWKAKIWSSYGIEKKYGDTWRETAELLSGAGMINLNSRWYDGRTYRQILDEALRRGKEGWNHMEKIMYEVLDKIIPDRDHNKGPHYSDIYNEEKFRDDAEDYVGRPFSSYELSNMERAITKEIIVINAVAFVHSDQFPFLPAPIGSYDDMSDRAISSIKFKPITLVDFDLYVIQFSLAISLDEDNFFFNFSL